MFISDGLRPSIFCQKIKSAHPMRENMDGKVLFSHQSRHFNLLISLRWNIFPYLYFHLACKQLCFPPGKGINWKNESTEKSVIFFWVLTIISCIVDFLLFVIRNCKTQIDFPSEKRHSSNNRWSLLFP